MQKYQRRDLIALAATAYPDSNYDFLDGAVFSGSLSLEDQQQFIQLLDFARALQIENSVYEPVYSQLLHLFVLNGSRLDLLKRIDRRLRGLAEEQGALMLISGDSGIGKTSLVTAFQERVSQLGGGFIKIHWYEQESTSYAAWQALARAAASITGMSIETLSAPIGQGKEALSSQQLKQSLAGWLNQAAAIHPLVILLDDLHWADVDSLEVLDHLTNQAIQSPILYIGTFRSEGTHSRQPLSTYLPKLQRNRQFDLIHLSPLTRDDVERFVTAFYGPCSPQLAGYLFERAEGHPLFTVELLNDLISKDLLSIDRNGFWLPPSQSVPVPAFLKGLITQRVSRLGDQAEELLSVAAVAGESWHLKIVEQLVEMTEDELLEVLEQGLRSEIITIEDENAEIYRFSHGLFRQVLYSRQLARRRKRFHELIAVQFEGQQPSNVNAIAYHFYEAENWGRAVDYCLAAGEEANRRFANYSALHWYQQALSAAERLGNLLSSSARLEIYERLGRTHLALGQRQEAELVYSRLRDVTQSSGDLVGEGYALVNLANVRMRLYQLDLAEKNASEALKIGEQTGDLRLLTHIHACMGGLRIARGQLDQATYHYDKVFQHAERFGDSGTLLDALRMKAYQATWVAQYSEAEKYAHRALKLARTSADPLIIVGANQNLSFAQIEAGNYLEAHQNILAMLRAVELSGIHHHQMPRLLNLMGYLFLELGEAQQALIWDQKALDAIQDTQVMGIEMSRYSLLNKATDYLYLGKLDEALDTIAQFETIKEGPEFVHFRYFNRYQLLMCEMYLAQLAFEQAIELAKETRQLAHSKGVLKNIAKSYWLEGKALAGLSHVNEAITHLEKAVEIVDSIQHGSLRWKIRLGLAEIYTRAGKSPQEVLRQARDLIEATVLSLSGSPLQDIFLSSHWVKQLEQLEYSPSPPKPTYPAGLTQREVEVLQLVARGATNQQVADALQISVRTANTHMTNILNKTGCENRTAASAFALQHELVIR